MESTTRNMRCYLSCVHGSLNVITRLNSRQRALIRPTITANTVRFAFITQWAKLSARQGGLWCCAVAAGWGSVVRARSSDILVMKTSLVLALVSFQLNHFLWSPYLIGRPYIFSCCFFFFFLFFPRLISAVGDWMFTILWHMVWP